MGTVSGVGGPQMPYSPKESPNMDLFKEVLNRFLDKTNPDDYAELMNLYGDIRPGATPDQQQTLDKMLDQIKEMMGNSNAVNDAEEQIAYLKDKLSHTTDPTEEWILNGEITVQTERIVGAGTDEMFLAKSLKQESDTL